MQGRDPAGEQGPHTARTTNAVDAQDERLWSILAHASVVIAPIGVPIISLVHKDRPERALPRPAGALVSGRVVRHLRGVLPGGDDPVDSNAGHRRRDPLPLMMVPPFAPLIYGCYAAYKVSQGEDYRYPFVVDRIDGGIHRVA